VSGSDETTAALRAELERVRLENETLSGVVGVVSSGPDLAHILDRVVDLLTRATNSHACFVYLRSGEQLRLRAASPVYSHLVGRISFGSDEGLAGWSMREGRPAFIREGALDDPRTVYVAELEEERFQSMVSVPIPSRTGESIGAIVLHTVAPREFDEGILNVLSRAASLVAGAIENARLYEQARERVEALTRQAELARQIAAVSDRASLFTVASEGMRDLLGADVCRLYESDPEGGLRLAAASPPASEGEGGGEEEAALVLDLLESGLSGGPEREALAALLGMHEAPAEAAAASLTAGGERLGVLVIAAREPWPDSAAEMMRALAHQVALALEKLELIARLTDENLARDFFDALATGELDLAAARSRAAGLDLERPHVLLELRPRAGEQDGEPWLELSETVERTVRRVLPGSVCDLGPAALRVLAPANSEDAAGARRVAAALAELAAARDLAIGASEARSGAAELSACLREARDAATIAAALLDRGEVMLYRDTGAYRYLIGLIERGGLDDHLGAAVERVAEYDRKRRSELLKTLDVYLDQGRSIAVTARALTIHVNTLRQRLERIETLAQLSLADEDLLALQLAVKLALIRGHA